MEMFRVVCCVYALMCFASLLLLIMTEQAIKGAVIPILIAGTGLLLGAWLSTYTEDQ